MWTRLARIYDVLVIPLRPLRREVARRVGAWSGMRILDVATGTGEQALAFARAGAEVVGVDRSAAMLRVAHRKDPPPTVSFRQADATALPFEDGRFDAACVSFALHEMPGEVRARTLAELARVTRPGGVVAVVDYGLPRGRASRAIVSRAVAFYEPDTYRDFIRCDLVGLLVRAGLEVTTDEPALRGLARIVMGRRPRPEGA